MLEFTRMAPEEIERLILDGTIHDQVSGALPLAWAKVRQHARISLVSEGIPAEHAHALGFTPFSNVEAALEEALHLHGDQSRVTVLTHAPDSLPVLME
jgi:hypothetical protein